MDYYKYNFLTNISDNEVLIALLSDLPFDTFMENETGFEGYMPVAQDDGTAIGSINELQTRFDFSFAKDFIRGENWNEIWESNFHPIKVEDFCGIRAEFHEPMKGVDHELIITPKMAFGTGHHETTYMVIQLMQGLDFAGKSVLDYGCGTGVLAILASRLGASQIDAIDIEEASWLNTLENCETNSVYNVHVRQGILSLVENHGYGIVLANINRNVILDSLVSLSHMLEKQGIIVFSGILKTDEDILSKALNENGFTCIKILERNNWIAMQCRLK